MANKDTETKSTLGLDAAVDRKEAEYDLTKALLEAASFRTDEDCCADVDIKRNGKFLFTVRIHPLSDQDMKLARKQAGIYKDNPTNKKLGKVKVDTDSAKLGSWMIYLATDEKDQEQVWGNKTIMQQFDLMQPWETIDVVLTTGEKSKLLDEVLKISDLADDEDEEDVNDEETFQS